MTWHPMTTQDIARAHQAALRAEAGRLRRPPSPRFRHGLAGTLRHLADRLDGAST
jgi:hypothetical protein